MTTEVLIQKVREELDVLDERSEQFVATLEKVLQDYGETSTPQLAQENFSGHNITLKEYEALPRVEKRRYHDEAEKLNQHWGENQLNSLQVKNLV